MSVTAHQVQNDVVTNPNGQVVPVVDRRLYDFLIGSSGIVTGGAITLVGGSTLHITSGWGVIKGCLFSISEQDVPVALSTSGTQTGILYLDLDITNNSISFDSKVGDITLTQEDINTNGVEYQLGLCTYTADDISVSNIVRIVQTITPIPNEIATLKTTTSGKQATITGGASSITSSNLTTNRALISDNNGKVAVSTVSSTELGYVKNVTSAIQTQLNSKQATITGGASTIAGSNLTKNRALISDANGKVAVSATTSTELGYVNGVTSAIQTQLNGKVSTGRKVATVALTRDITKAEVGYMVGTLSGTTLTLTGP